MTTKRLEFLSLADLARQVEAADEKIRRKRRWGPWVLRRETLELQYEEDGRVRYWVDLGRCGTSAEVLDWICQVKGKAWCTVSALGHLVTALDNLLRPQANLCSGGAEQGPIEITEVPIP